MLAESKRDITNLICDSRPYGDRHFQHAKRSDAGFSSRSQCNPSPCSLLQYTFPPSLLFLLFLLCLWAITLLAGWSGLLLCTHYRWGRVHIYFMTDILNQAPNSSMLYLLKASAAANPSPPPFPAAPGKVALLFIFLSHAGWTTVHFCIQRFILRFSSDSDFLGMMGKKRGKK